MTKRQRTPDPSEHWTRPTVPGREIPDLASLRRLAAKRGYRVCKQLHADTALLIDRVTGRMVTSSPQPLADLIAQLSDS